jgi:hypothetical protein
MEIEMLNQVIHQDALAKPSKRIANQCKELAALITRYTNGKGDGFHKTDIDKLEFQRQSSAPAALHRVSEPIFAILVQGKKEALLGEGKRILTLTQNMLQLGLTKFQCSLL